MSDSIKAIAECHGDPSVGIPGMTLEMDTGLLEFEDREHREFVRATIRACYSDIWMEPFNIRFEDELDEPGEDF